MERLIDNLLCTVTAERDVLTCNFPRLTKGIVILTGFLLVGAASFLYGLYGFASGWSDSGGAGLSGVVMLVFSGYILYKQSVEHGNMTLTESALSWERGGKIIESWTKEDVTMVKTTRSLLSHHGGERQDHHLHVHHASGRRIRIAYGSRDEVTAVEACVRQIWHDVE